jgi:hypothetical protein
MKDRQLTLLAALAILFFSPGSLAGQAAKQRPAPASASQAEPLRLIGGELQANTVTGHVKKGWTATPFSFSLTRAEIVKGRLQLAGDFALGGAPAQARDQVTATIGGIMANAANPWPNAREERRSDAKKSKQEEMSTTCSVIFLNLTLPRRLQARIGSTATPLQLGVVLKPFDNQRGEEIVKQICLLLKLSKSPNQSVHVDQLNRLFVPSR